MGFENDTRNMNFFVGMTVNRFKVVCALLVGGTKMYTDHFPNAESTARSICRHPNGVSYRKRLGFPFMSFHPMASKYSHFIRAASYIDVRFLFICHSLNPHKPRVALISEHAVGETFADDSGQHSLKPIPVVGLSVVESPSLFDDVAVKMVRSNCYVGSAKRSFQHSRIFRRYPDSALAPHS